MAVHADDIKIAGKPEEVHTILVALQREFVDMKLIQGNFTSCGIRHTQHQDGSVTLYQEEYASKLRHIAHPQMSAGSTEDLCVPGLRQLYMSLLGAVAYLSHTRADSVVCISALQRHNAKPNITHVKRFNRLLTWIQQNPLIIRYGNLFGPQTAKNHAPESSVECSFQ